MEGGADCCGGSRHLRSTFIGNSQRLQCAWMKIRQWPSAARNGADGMLLVRGEVVEGRAVAILTPLGGAPKCGVPIYT